jgi:hypothetical protein
LYVRRDRKHLKDGRAAVYLTLAHNVVEHPLEDTIKPRSKPVIFAQLGREDQLDDKTVRGMRDALDRYLQRRRTDHGEPPELVADAVRVVVPALKILASREFGLRQIIEPVWDDLGLRDALRTVGDEHACTYDFERVVFAMVLNRLVDPKSKRACGDWVREHAYFPEGETWQEQHFYRALDLLDARSEDLFAAIGKAVRTRLSNEELSVILMDTTSSYFESDFDDVERGEISEEWAAFDRGEGDMPSMPRPQVVNEPALRRRGHSKDRRPREPQVKIGLATTARGALVHVDVEAGNVSDQRMTKSLVDRARSVFSGRTLAVVMDSGMGGSPNLAAIDAMEPPVHRVSAVPLRNSKFAETEVLAKAGRWGKHPYKEGFTYRAHKVAAADSPSGREEWWIATRNEAEGQRQRRLLDKEIERVKEALEQDDRVDGHGEPVCRLLANPKHKRLVRVGKGGHLVLDQDHIRVERRRAGVHVLRTTLTHLGAEVSLQAYDAQYGIEDQFRTYKGPLRLRPMHHRATRRIRAHILVCSLALMVLRELERRSGCNYEQLRKLFGAVRVVRVEQSGVRFWQREKWGPDALEVLERLDLRAGPLTWGAETVGAE